MEIHPERFGGLGYPDLDRSSRNKSPHTHCSATAAAADIPRHRRNPDGPEGFDRPRAGAVRRGSHGTAIRPGGRSRTASAPWGSAGGIFADELVASERGLATVFVPFSGNTRRPGRLTELVVPAAELATVVHAGSYRDFDLAYGALATHVAQHAIAIDGPIREYFLVGPQDTRDETAWRTEIGWPVFHTTTA